MPTSTNTWQAHKIDPQADPPHIVAVSAEDGRARLGVACLIDGAPAIRWITFTPVMADAMRGLEVVHSEPEPIDLTGRDVARIMPSAFWRYVEALAHKESEHG